MWAISTLDTIRLHWILVWIICLNIKIKDMHFWCFWCEKNILNLSINLAYRNLPKSSIKVYMFIFSCQSYIRYSFGVEFFGIHTKKLLFVKLHLQNYLCKVYRNIVLIYYSNCNGEVSNYFLMYIYNSWIIYKLVCISEYTKRWAFKVYFLYTIP